MIICFDILTGLMTAEIPNTSEILMALLPRIFPMEIPCEPFIAATRLTKNSGAEVARETMVKPIMTGRTANKRAVDTAPSTSRVEPT